jgi:hypothetical protein
VLVLAAVTGVLLRRRSRRRAWQRQFDATKSDAAWFARGLLPQLEQAPTPQQVAGGWRMEAARVVALEDRLTGLTSAATAQEDGQRAVVLRDAVRSARSRLEQLGAVTDAVTVGVILRSATADIETALAAVDPQTPGTETPPGTTGTAGTPPAH